MGAMGSSGKGIPGGSSDSVLRGREGTAEQGVECSWHPWPPASHRAGAFVPAASNYRPTLMSWRKVIWPWAQEPPTLLAPLGCVLLQELVWERGLASLHNDLPFFT